MLFVQLDAVEVSQVEDETPVGKCLSTHAVLLSRARDFQIVLAGPLKGIADVVLMRDFHDAVHRGPVQVAGIIGESALLSEGDRRRLWRRQKYRRLFLIGVVREDEIAFLLLVGRGGVIKDLLGATSLHAVLHTLHAGGVALEHLYDY